MKKRIVFGTFFQFKFFSYVCSLCQMKEYVCLFYDLSVRGGVSEIGMRVYMCLFDSLSVIESVCVIGFPQGSAELSSS